GAERGRKLLSPFGRLPSISLPPGRVPTPDRHGKEEMAMTTIRWALRCLASVAALAILVGAAQTQAPANRPAAVGNGEPISLAKVEAFLKMRGPTPTPLTEQQRKQMQFEMVNALIDDVLMRQFLAKNAPKVDPAEVSKRLAELQTGLKKQGKTVQDFCRESGQ